MIDILGSVGRVGIGVLMYVCSAWSFSGMFVSNVGSTGFIKWFRCDDPLHN